ncbi:MAG: M23 family metallopeptidase [Desulfotomaculales bacterium]
MFIPGGDRRRLKEAAREAKKQALKILVKKLLKMALKKLLAAIAPLVISWWPVVLAFFAALLLFAAIYAAMPQNQYLTGVEPSAHDAEILREAEEQTAENNVKDTWLTRRNGARERLGYLADNYGRETALPLINSWGDIYAPALQKALQESADNKLEDMGWVKGELKKLAFDLRPKFEYKESTVTVCNKDGECDSYTVFLLTEADTIRGHYVFKYEWATEHYPGGGSRTYEKPVGQELVGPKWRRLEEYLQKYLDIPEKDAPLARQMVFEAGQGFTARKEWLTWLTEVFGGASWASGAMVPPELMAYFREAEQTYGLPWWFLAAVAMTESSFNPSAENARTGCYGLMQVSPENWQAYAPKLGFDPDRDKDNPRAQIMVGAYLLKNYLGGVNWEGDWKEATLDGLTFYGGFRTAGRVDDLAKERCRQEYASKIWALAETFKSAPAAWPVPGYYEISSYYGYRTHPITGKWTFHEGIDIPAPEGAPVVSVSGGIAYVYPEPEAGGYGNLVVVKDGMYEYYYAHLLYASVVSGQMLRPGDQIGGVDNTGSSTGNHLHFGVKPLDSQQFIDPLEFLKGVR